MNASSVFDLRRFRVSSVPGTAGWAGNGQAPEGLFAEKGRAMASGGLQPAGVTGAPPPARPGQPARLTEAVLGAKRTAFVRSAGSAVSAPLSAQTVAENAGPVRACGDPQTAEEPADAALRPAPARRRVRTTMRLDPERRRRLNLVSSFTGSTAQAVIVAALEAYLRDLAPCPADVPEAHPKRARGARACSPARGSQRSLRLHPHLFWRLAVAARKTRGSMQSILVAALDLHLDTAAPAIGAEVFSCLMGWTDEAGVSTPRSTPRLAYLRAQNGQPAARRRRRHEGLRGASPRQVGLLRH